MCCLGLIVFVGGCGLNKRTTVVPADNSRTAVQSSSEQVPDIERETPDEVADITTSVTVADGWTTYADAEYLFTMSYPETAELQEVGDSTRNFCQRLVMPPILHKNLLILIRVNLVLELHYLKLRNRET